jgi:hypothetical protein
LSLVTPGKAADVRVGLLAVGVVLLAYGCDDRDRTERPIETGMKVIRKDGSRVRFADRAVAECYETLDGKRTTRWFYVEADTGPRGSYWVVRRKTDEIERSPALVFPASEPGALFLVFDPITGYKLRSDDSLASGRLVIEEWGCEADDSARISVHGTLASDGRRKSVSRVDGDVVPVFLAEAEDD